MYLQVALEFVVLLDQPETKKVATNDGEWWFRFKGPEGPEKLKIKKYSQQTSKY